MPPRDRDDGGRPVLGLVAGHGPGVGSGHLGRCLALAQAWIASGGRAVLADDGLPPSWAARYGGAGVELAEPSALVAADVCVVDGYDLPADLPTRLRRTSLVAVIDDGGERLVRHGVDYDADWVLDQNLGADAAPYARRDPGGRLLLGSRYALLRREVVAARPAQRPSRRGTPTRLLVSMGGDPAPELRQLFDQVLSAPAIAERHLHLVPLQAVEDVGPVLAGVDVALAAAGSTTWELCAHGVPSVVVVIAENQRIVARRAATAGLVVDGGDLGQVDAPQLVARLVALLDQPERREACSLAGWDAIDGDGARRVAVELRAGLVRLRRATADDEHLLWVWANDPEVRRHAFATEPIALASHQRWLAGRLASPDSAIWIAQDHQGLALGQVRVDVDGGVASLDYSIAPTHRGGGWAAPLLVTAQREAFATFGPDQLVRIDAQVIEGNAASERALARAGMVPGPHGSTAGRRWHTYTHHRHG